MIKAIHACSAALFLITTSMPLQASSARKIDLECTQIPVKQCIAQLLEASGSAATIKVHDEITEKISWKASQQPWDTVLQEILAAKHLKLAKDDSGYVIKPDPPPAISQKSSPVISESRSGNSRHNDPLDVSLPDMNDFLQNPHLDNFVPLHGEQTEPESEFVKSDKCSDENIITLGYEWGEDSNPFQLAGHCVKVYNVKPFQYLSQTTALATWTYRGTKGTIFIENRSATGSLSKSKYLIAEAVDPYEYVDVTNAPRNIPHLVIH